MTEGNGNAVDYFVDRHLREGRGDRLAFADPWRRLTYGELAAESARFASGLRRAGIERERRIALVMLDTVDFPIAFWGALRAGVVPVPINTLLPPEITFYILRDSRAAALFVSAPLFEKLREAAERAGIEPRRGQRTGRIRRRFRCVSRRWRGGGGGRMLAGRGRVLAVFVGLDRRAEGRAGTSIRACARRPKPTARRCSASRPTI